MRYLALAVLLSQLWLSNVARAIAPERLHLVKVQVTGSKRYVQEDLVRATGLTAPSQVTQDDLQNAANRLGTTGAFASIQFTFKPTTGVRGVEADFVVEDSPQFLPASFENFLWFSDAELQQQIHSAVPLFSGSLPQSGSMAEDVKAALKNVLAAKGLPSNVSYQLAGAFGGAVSGFRYKVEDADFRIKEFQFAGANRLGNELLSKSVQAFRGEQYSRDQVQSIVEKNILPVYQDRGFLRASVDHVKPQIDGGNVVVAVAVTEGEQYKLAGFQWSGNTVIASQDLSRQISLKIGDPVNSSKLQEDLGKVRKAYGKFGREAAFVKMVPSFNADSVSYVFEVHEGDLYRMGKFQLEGVSADLAAKLSENWKLAPGAPYDNTYVLQFFRNVASKMPMRSWEWMTVEDVDSTSKIVNVRLELTRK